jgi:hypothetical protein
MWPGLLRRMLLHCNADSFEQEAGRRVSGFGTGGLGCHGLPAVRGGQQLEGIS